MKKIMTLVIMLSLITTFSSCKSKSIASSTKPLDVDSSIKVSSCAITVLETNSSYFKYFEKKSLIFRSRGEVDIFINFVLRPTYDHKNIINNQIAKYTDNWFNDHILCCTAVMEPAAPTYYSLKRVEKYIESSGNKNVTIEIEKSGPETALCIVVYNCLFIEMNRSEVEDVPNENFSLKIIDSSTSSIFNSEE